MSEMIHAIEGWLMEYGVWGLFFVSFADSSFFPIPPDVLLIPMGISNPDSVIRYAFITTVASVLGAIFGWFIGKKLGRPVLRLIISEEKIQKVEHYFSKYGPMAILVSAFTPIPYKVFTIFAGISKVPLRVLVIWSIIGRGARFFLEAAFIIVLGAKAKPFIEENFSLITIIGSILIVVAYVIYLLIRKKKKN
ncbi:YqaA family protein [Bacillus sp. S/N-304-OC-R1]|uniref:YqaA family protein n=1 Tax=Bacillus sp. S/N-304-OC-R1 TaxID=2758034 RepID=UPI001C8DF0C2|nr:YqaA family protein [Bacillus sp. S/N-304-OC-R1]MBY0121200.1 DedA family protein [Bacillus sp. S/N-304-OC-R1]